MTRQKHLKGRIRARMAKTGERYTVARRHVLAKAAPPAVTGPAGFHLPGVVRRRRDALPAAETATLPQAGE